MFECKELSKNFETKEEMFSELRKYKSQIISMKKAQVYKSCEKDEDKRLSIISRPLDISKISEQIKAIDFSSNDYYYIAVNSTRILDSHKDMHVDGIWNKTKKEQQGKNYLVADHKLELDKTIVKKEYVEILTATMPFSMIGKKYAGDTEVLIYKFRKDKVINQVAKEWLESGDSIEGSVRMQYVDIIFAANSDDKEDIKEKKSYDDYIDVVANKDDFENGIDYFWIVKQAKNIAESSLVIFGSNSATGQIVLTKEFEVQPSEDTEQKIEPEIISTQKGIDYEFLNKNFNLTI